MRRNLMNKRRQQAVRWREKSQLTLFCAAFIRFSRELARDSSRFYEDTNLSRVQLLPHVSKLISTRVSFMFCYFQVFQLRHVSFPRRGVPSNLHAEASWEEKYWNQYNRSIQVQHLYHIWMEINFPSEGAVFFFFLVIILLSQLLSQKSVLLRGARTYSGEYPYWLPRTASYWSRIKKEIMSSATGTGIKLDATGV